MTNFNTTISLSGSDEDDFLPVEVSYEMRDLGVMGHHNEKLRPVIRVVRFKSGRLDSLTDDQIERLEDEALINESRLAGLAES